jgi:hypothetical protein
MVIIENTKLELDDDEKVSSYVVQLHFVWCLINLSAGCLCESFFARSPSVLSYTMKE